MSAFCSTSNAGGLCSLPLVHRAYMAAVVGVAAFLAVILGLRDPFRGYQTEVRLRGAASEAIDPHALRDWLRAADRTTALAISGGTEQRPEVEIRIGRIAPRLTEAAATLDALARRALLEYLPQAQSAYRQRLVSRLEQELQLTRDAEQTLAARSRDLAARQQSSPAPLHESPLPEFARRMELAPSEPAPLAEPKSSDNPLFRQLDALRLELARLLANFTDEHPQVAAIRRQISNLEQQLGVQAAADAGSARAPDAIPLPPARPATFTSITAVDQNTEVPPNYSAMELPAPTSDEIQQVAAQLSAATAARQSAERKLHTTLAALSLQSPAAGWTADPARLVTRLGGTPRMLSLLLSLVAAVVAGAVMFRTTFVLTGPQVLATTTDLARALPIPLIGQTPLTHKPRPARPGRWITPSRVRLLTRCAEIWLVALLVLSAVAVCLDHTLAGQLAADPLGVLSEIVGRFTGH